METNLRARRLSETRGFVKAFVAADSDLILGYTALGLGAGETLVALRRQRPEKTTKATFNNGG